MRPPGQDDDGRPRDYGVVDGMLVHKRWLNPDGSRKDGLELKKEQMLVELQQLTKRLLALAKELGA